MGSGSTVAPGWKEVTGSHSAPACDVELFDKLDAVEEAASATYLRDCGKPGCNHRLGKRAAEERFDLDSIPSNGTPRLHMYAGSEACPASPKPLGASLTRGKMVVALMDSDDVDLTVRAVLVDILGLPEERVQAFTEVTPLFGALPEFDSMAVAGLLTELEERLGILIDDEDVDADILASYGALVTFAKAKALR